MYVTLLELGFVVAACSPGVRLLLRRDLMRIAPWFVAVLSALLGALATVVIYAALHAATLLHALTLVAGVLWAASAWRARTGYGRSQGLPPGSLSLTGSLEAIVDRRFYERQYERIGPIFKMAQFHRGVVCVVGLERGHRLLREHRESLGPGELPFTREISGGFLRYMEGETYERYGNLFRGALSGAVVREAEPVTRQVIRDELGRMVEDCASSGEGVRLGGYLERVVFASFLRVLFDLTPDRPAFRELQTLYGDLRAQKLGRRLTARTKASLEEMRALVRREAERLRKRDPESAPPGSALEALVRADPAMPDSTCIDNLLFILKIASANVASLLHWIVKHLADHPEWLQRVRAERDEDDSLADCIVLETLRLEQSEYLYRTIRSAFQYEGFVFPPGWLLRICVKESHRDRGVFPEAETFAPDRFLARRFTRAEYSPFGASQHACNGVDLTNMIARCLVEELARGFESRVVRDGPLERDFRHWDHWRPSARLRLAVSRRPAASPLSAGLEPGLPARGDRRHQAASW